MIILQRRLVRLAAAAVVVVGCGGVIVGPQSAQASLTPFFVDFDTAPFAGNPTSFTSGGFTFTFTAAGNAGDFGISLAGGEGGTGAISALSTNHAHGSIERVFITRTDGGVFIWDSIYINGPDHITAVLAFAPLGTQLYSEFGGPGITTFTTLSGIPFVDTVEIRNLDFNSLIFDSFAGELFMVSPVPLPAALPLFGSALAMLGIVGWRRKQRGDA